MIPDDLPEHSLVSYNPNRSRFERLPSAGSGATRPSSDAANDEEDASASERIETEFHYEPAATRDARIVEEVQDSRHRLVRLIGRGGCGEVWEAIQVQLDRPVAVKRLREDKFGKHSDDSSREEMIRYFREEALIAARLDHPNIVPVYDYAPDETGAPELSMKLVRGRPWSKMLKTDRESIKFEDLVPRHVAILAAVANSVAFAHSRNIVHRDIKPSQVMVGDYGEVLLMDWGLALVFGGEVTYDQDEHLRTNLSSLPTLSTASSPAGTPAYMAPEQTLPTAEFIGPWTDVYLLGGCLYCILVGTGPYGDSPSHEAFVRAAEANVRDPRSVLPDVDIPDELADLALKALAREPRDRIESAEAFVQRLEDWISGASRRRESERLTTEIASEIGHPRTRYSEFVGTLNRIHQAAGLWPANPAIPTLRSETLSEYSELALAKGDLLLAQTEAEMLPASSVREALLARVEDARVQRQRTRRALRIAVTAVFFLIVLGVGGTVVSFKRIDRERVEALSQEARATRAATEAESARAEAERSREKALNDQIYAQVRYATSLVEAGRHDMARSVLWSIPESSRNWEWAWLLNRAHQPLAEFPFKTMEASKDGEWLFVDGGGGNIEVRDTMAGALVARLDHETSEVLLLVPQKDTHVDTLDGSRRLVRWSPPDWKPRTLTEFSVPASVAKRVFGTDEFLVALKDNSVVILDGNSGEERLRLPPARERIVSIDAYPAANILLVASERELAMYQYRDGSLLRRAAMPMTVLEVSIIGRGKRVLINQGRWPYVYDVENGNVIMITHPTGVKAELASHPEADSFARLPDFIRVSDNQIIGEFPVSGANTARIRFLNGKHALFWAGTNREAGLFEFHGRRTTTRIEGLDSEIENMWATVSARWNPTIMDASVVERIFTTTAGGRTQVWLAGVEKSIAQLPGQWGSFRENGTLAVTIGRNTASVEWLDGSRPPHQVGNDFSLYRSISIKENRHKIYSYGLPLGTGKKFGWEVYDMLNRSREQLVAAGTTPEQLPNLWIASDDDTRVITMWDESGGGEIWSTEGGNVIARIEPTGAAPTALRTTPWETLYISDVAGVVREVSLADGREIRRVEIGQPIWAIRADFDRGRLLVSGGDGIWRIFAVTKDGADLALSAPTNAGPVVSAHFSAGGASLLAQTREGMMIVWEIPSGKEVVRFKADANVFKVVLNREGTRIFGIGEEGLFVWDMLGREVARVPGVRDIGADGRRLLAQSDKFAFARDIAIELPPYRIEELPGVSGQSFETRYQLYRQEEYRDWLLRRAATSIPPTAPAVLDAASGTIADGGRAIRHSLELVVNELSPRYRDAGPALIPLVRCCAELASLEDGREWEFARGLWGLQSFSRLEDPESRGVIRALAPYALLHAATDARISAARELESYPVHTVSATAVFAELGRMTEAKQLARYTLAKGAITLWNPNPDETAFLNRFLDSPVPEPPKDLVPVSNPYSPSHWGMREFEKLVDLDLDTEEFAKRCQEILEREDQLQNDWLKSVAPLPDLAALEAEFRAALPPPPPGDMLLSDFLGDTLHQLTKTLLDGHTLAEARDAMAARFDASVAAAESERPTK